jgi:hypothetical protein
VIVATSDDLLGYLADVIAHAERFGVTILPPNHADEVAWARDGDSLVMRIGMRLPAGTRSRPIELILSERWRASDGLDRWRLAEYAHELRHHELDYRRALHRHDEAHFIRAFGVVTHEHCESPMGYVTCRHYGGDPIGEARSGFERLYGIWLSGAQPDCSRLRCLE